MKKFVVMILAAVMLLSMVPVSAIEYVAEEGEDISEIISRSEGTGFATCRFTIDGKNAEVVAIYIGSNTFSYAKVYTYIQKNVNGNWVSARDDKQCAWSGTYYEAEGSVSNKVELTSRGTYRGRAVIYIYSTNGTNDKWDVNKEQVY